MFETPAASRANARRDAPTQTVLRLNDAPAHEVAGRFCRKYPQSWLAQQLRADVEAKERHTGPDLAPWHQLGYRLCLG